MFEIIGMYIITFGLLTAIVNRIRSESSSSTERNEDDDDEMEYVMMMTN